jgi:hypothetical protein
MTARATAASAVEPWPWRAQCRTPVATSIVEPLRAYGAYAQALYAEIGADDAAVLLCYLGRRPDWKL